VKKIYILILFVFAAQNLQAQFSSSSDYFPLQVGNMWKYKKFSTGSGHDFTYLTVTITKDSIVDANRSYYLHHDPPQSDYWVTYDSLSGILYYGNQPGVPFLRLSASTGDTTNFVCIAETDTLHYNIPSRIKNILKI
jgi:hypothetical protein